MHIIFSRYPNQFQTLHVEVNWIDAPFYDYVVNKLEHREMSFKN